VQSKEIDFGIPIISVGNIIVGGSGKTPITIKLASKYERCLCNFKRLWKSFKRVFCSLV
jgi:tetraacyldisaccharide 4'-kinase